MDIDQIISKYLNGEISLDEQHKLTQWLSESPANQQAFDDIRKYWKSYFNDYQAERDEVEGWIFDRIHERSLKQEIPKSSRSLRIRTLTGIAASIILILGSILIINQYEEFTGKETITSLQQNAFVEKVSLPGQKITTKLPDGTVVHLNSGSRLVVPDKFSPTIREVELTGEAFFDVFPDHKRPFLIRTGEFVVRVLGTSFNIRAYPNMKDKSVAVKTGIVSVSSGSNKSVELNPGQMVNIQADRSLSKITKVDDKLIYGWMDHFLVFKDDTLSEVFEQISLWFGVEVIYDEKAVPQKLFTATFDNPTLKELMLNVSGVYGFNYRINDEEVMIDLK